MHFILRPASKNASKTGDKFYGLSLENRGEPGDEDALIRMAERI